MDAASEGEVARLFSAYVQGIGVGKHGGVAVCCADQGDDGLACVDSLVADLHIFERDAPVHLNGWVVSEELVYCQVQQVGLAAETLELFGVFQEGEHAVADQVARCFVAGYEQEDQGCHQFCVRQAVARLFCGHEVAGQVGPWFAPSLRYDFLEVRFQFHPRLSRPFDVFVVEDRFDAE